MAFSCGHFLELINLSLSDFFFDWCTVGFFLLLLKSLSSFYILIIFSFSSTWFSFVFSFFHTTLLKHICKYVWRLLSCIWFFFLDLSIHTQNRIEEQNKMTQVLHRIMRTLLRNVLEVLEKPVVLCTKPTEGMSSWSFSCLLLLLCCCVFW